MILRGFHIDGFGIWSNAGLNKLGSGLTIFLGDNEAGKSSCMEFLRTTLTGYPPRKNMSGALNGGRQGGTLALETRNGLRFSITRRKSQKPLLCDAEGAPLSPSLLEQLLGGIGYETYRRVFGFSLSELEAMEGLSGIDSGQILAGASYGVDLARPGDVLNSLQSRMDHIFKARGRQQLLNSELNALAHCRKELNANLALRKQYDDLVTKRDSLEQEQERNRNARTQLAARMGLRENRIRAWEIHEQLLAARNSLLSLPAEDRTFPLESAAKLDEMERQIDQDRIALTQAEGRLEALEESLRKATPDCRLLAKAALIRQLAGRKSSYGRAVAEIPRLDAERSRQEQDLGQELARLGRDWTCRRIRESDRSLLVDEELETKAASLNNAREEMADAERRAAILEENAAKARIDLQNAKNTLAQIPAPLHLLTAKDRESIRLHIKGIADRQRRLDELSLEIREARDLFAESASRLVRQGTAGDIAPLPVPSGNIVAGLDEAQPEMQFLAGRVREALERKKKAEEGYATQQHEHAGRSAELQKAETAIAGLGNVPGAQEISAQNAALRQARALYATRKLEEERLEDAGITREDAIRAARKNCRLPRSGSHGTGFLITGFLFLLLTGLLLVALLSPEIASLFNVAPYLPENLAGNSEFLLLLLASGVLSLTLITAGIVRFAAGTGRAKANDRLLQRFLDRCRNIDAQLEKLQPAAGLAECSDAGFVLAEKDLADSEDKRRELDSLEAERKIAQDRATAAGSAKETARKAVLAESSIVEEANRAWSAFSAKFPDIPLPKPDEPAALAAFCSRIHAAAGLWQQLSRLLKDEERECGKGNKEEAELKRLLSPYAPVIDQCTADELWREAGKILDSDSDWQNQARKHNEAEENCTAAQRRALEQEKTLSSQRDTVTAAQQSLHEAERDWQGFVSRVWPERLREGEQPSFPEPALVQKALSIMQHCLEMEKHLDTLGERRSHALEEKQALEKPLERLAAELGYPQSRPDSTGSGPAEAYWIGLLEELENSLDAASALKAENSTLCGQKAMEEKNIESLRETLGRHEKELSDFLDRSGCPDAEQFRKKADIMRRIRSAKDREQELAASLTAIASPMPLNCFLGTFEAVSLEEEHENLAEEQQEKKQLEAEEKELLGQYTKVKGDIERLENDNHAAELEQEAVQHVDAIRTFALEWTALALARSLLEATRRTYEQTRQPEVIRTASEIFAEVTDGKWQGLYVSLDNTDEILPISHSGERLTAGALSRGTREQAWIALRLGYILSREARAEPLPVLMDDVLVNFDPARAQRMAKVFAGRFDHPGRQLFCFTCHPSMARMLIEAAPGARLVTVRDGQFSMQE